MPTPARRTRTSRARPAPSPGCKYLFRLSTSYVHYTDLHSFPTRRSSDLYLVFHNKSTGVLDVGYFVGQALWQAPLFNAGKVQNHGNYGLGTVTLTLTGGRKSTRLNSSNSQISYAHSCATNKNIESQAGSIAWLQVPLPSLHLIRPLHRSTLFPYTTLFRSLPGLPQQEHGRARRRLLRRPGALAGAAVQRRQGPEPWQLRPWHRHSDPDRRPEEHTSELQQQSNLVCPLLRDEQEHREPGRLHRLAASTSSVSPPHTSTTQIYTLSLHDALPISTWSSTTRARACSTSATSSARRSGRRRCSTPARSRTMATTALAPSL